MCVQVSRVSTSCGFGVPLMDYKEDRPVLNKWAAAEGQDGLDEYRSIKNARNIDGLTAFDGLLPSESAQKMRCCRILIKYND